MKPCSPLHPVNVGLLLLGAGAIGMAARSSSRGSRGMMLPGFSGFDVFDEPQGPIRTTRADLFRSAGIGYTFRAHGREWKVVNSPGTPGHRIIQGHPPKAISVRGNFQTEPALYAYLDGETLVVHALSKRGAFAPVGKVLWREDMSDEVKTGGSRAAGQQGISLGNLRQQAQHQHKAQKAAQTQQTRRRPRFRHTPPKTPSAQALSQRLKIPSDKAQDLHDLMREGRIGAAMQAAKSAMDAYDVKVIRGKTEVPMHFTGLEYVDTADAWSDTLIYDYGLNQFLIAPWGVTVDANKDRF